MALYGLNKMYKGNGDTGLLESYYGGMAKPNPVANTLGGQFKTGVATNPALNPQPTQVRRPTFNQVTGQLDLGQGTQRYGTVGQYLEDPASNIARSQGYDPRYYEQYQRDIGDSNTETAWRVRQDVRDRLGNRIQVNQPGVVGRNPDGSIMEGQGFNEVLDPNQVEWDDEFGWVMNKDNLSGSDPDDKARWDRIRMAAIAATLGGAAWVGGAIPGLAGAEGAASISAPGMAMPTLAGAESGALAAAPALGAVGGGAGTASIAAPAMAMPELVGAASPALSAAPTIAGGGSSSLLSGGLRAGSGIVQAILNRNNANNITDTMNRTAEQQDPFGPYRAGFAQQLVDAYKDPDKLMGLLEQTPGYQFALRQGRQGLNRRGAATGYYRSPNLDYDLAQFQTGLAQSTWDKEISRIMQMAGVNIDPSGGASTRNQSALFGGSMNQSMWNNIFGAVNTLANNDNVGSWIASLFEG